MKLKLDRMSHLGAAGLRTARSRVSRRRFLQAGGAAAAGTFLLPKGTGSLLAQPPTAPRRVVFVVGEQGWVHKNWSMRPAGLTPPSSGYVPYDPRFDNRPDAEEWEFSFTDSSLSDPSSFSRGLRPLHEFRSQLIALDGLGLVTALADPEGDDHAKGHCSALTGAPASYTYDGVKSFAAQPSVDQIIARHIRSSDPTATDLTSIEYGAHRYNGNSFGRFHHFIYDQSPSGIVTVPAQADPLSAYDQLFGFLPPDDGQMIDPVRAAQDRMLQIVQQQYEANRAINPRIANHGELVQGLRDRMAILSQTTCSRPDRPTRLNGASEREIFEHNAEEFTSLIASAFSCGVSRIATLQLADIPPQMFTEPGGGTANGDLHNDYAHGSGPYLEFGQGTDVNEFNLRTEVMTQHMEYQTRVVASLARKLNSIPEGNGTVLDNTSIVLINEIGHGDHGHILWPVTIVGGMGGAFRAGRYVKYAMNTPNPANRNYSHQYAGLSHTHLLVSICQAMGMNIDHFGFPSVRGEVQAGPNSGQGRNIDLSGPLPRLG